MKGKIVVVVGLILFSAFSCDKEKLNPNEVYKSKELRVEFTNFSDSRCPHNADCIWAGEATVFLKATSGNQSVDFSLTGLGSDTVLFNHQIEFVDLLPYPSSTNETSFEDKELVLNVTEL